MIPCKHCGRFDSGPTALELAAPAMLEALNFLLECHDAMPGANPSEMAWDTARAAIAQAKGD